MNDPSEPKCHDAGVGSLDESVATGEPCFLQDHGEIDGSEEFPGLLSPSKVSTDHQAREVTMQDDLSGRGRFVRFGFPPSVEPTCGLPAELSSILRSCESITSAAMSCRTLKCIPSDLPGDDEDSDFAVELDVASWLQSQLDEYRIALVRRNIEQVRDPFRDLDAHSASMVTEMEKPSGDKESGDESPGETRLRRHHKNELKRLKGELFDETVRAEQEKLLLGRVVASCRVAPFTTFPDVAGAIAGTPERSEKKRKQRPLDTALGDDVEHENENENENEQHNLSGKVDFDDPDALHLRREALRARDALMLKVLYKTEQKRGMLDTLDRVLGKCREWQRKNWNLWNQLQSSRKDRGKGEGSAAQLEGLSDCKEMNQREGSERVSCVLGIEERSNIGQWRSAMEQKRLRNALLKHALLNVIVSSGLNWHENRRLRDTIMRLEE